MNTKVKKLLTVILIVGQMFISACGSDEVTQVRKIPDGFIRLPDGGEYKKLSWMGWETQIVFMDKDENCIYQTGFNNSEFIVWYKDAYYVNEEKFNKMLEIAEQGP